MITFILVAIGAIIVAAAIVIAYVANGRKRAGQTGQAEVRAQQNQDGSPKIGRPTGVN